MNKITPSGSFQPADHAAVPVYTGQDINSAVTELTNRYTEGLRRDREEVANAQAAANGPLCSDGYDKAATESNFTAYESDAQSTMDTFSSRVSGWVANADAVAHNQTPHDSWGGVMAQLSTIVDDTKQLGTESWQDSAADAYRDNQARRTQEAHALATLAENTRNGVGALASLQAQLTEALADSLNTALRTSPEVWAMAAPRKQSAFEAMQSEVWSSFRFYSRSAAVVAAVRGVNEVLSQLNAGTDWHTSSQQIRDSLKAAVEAARQLNDQTRVQYTSGGPIDVGPQHCYDGSGVSGVDSTF